jgi:hypothetical protein
MSDDFTVVKHPDFVLVLNPSEAVLLAHVLSVYNGGAGGEYGLVGTGPERVTAALAPYLQALPSEIKCWAFSDALGMSFTTHPDELGCAMLNWCDVDTE